MEQPVQYARFRLSREGRLEVADIFKSEFFDAEILHESGFGWWLRSGSDEHPQAVLLKHEYVATALIPFQISEARPRLPIGFGSPKN